MWLAITGGSIVGIIGLAAVYDHLARRRGRNESFGGHRGSPTYTAQQEHNGFYPS